MDDKRKDIVDNGGRRMGIDRRQVPLPYDGAERRAGTERRSGSDRRNDWSFSGAPEERRETYHLK